MPSAVAGAVPRGSGSVLRACPSRCRWLFGCRRAAASLPERALPGAPAWLRHHHTHASSSGAIHGTRLARQRDVVGAYSTAAPDTGASLEHDGGPDADAGAAAASPAYDVRVHVAEAEGLLRQLYGPQAKLLVRSLTQRGGSASAASEPGAPASSSGVVGATPTAEPDGVDDADALAPDGTGTTHTSRALYRVSATFRLLGFPVELAVTKGRHVEATVDNCLRQAMSSDIEFLMPRSRRTPHPSATVSRRPKVPSSPYAHDGGGSRSQRQQDLRAVLDELKQLCITLSYGLKLSVKPPHASITRFPDRDKESADNGEDSRMAAADAAARRVQWRCRAYMKDEWSTLARMELACEATGPTPNSALHQCLCDVRDHLRRVLESPAVQQEMVRELGAYLAPMEKTVRDGEVYKEASNTEPHAATPSNAREHRDHTRAPGSARRGNRPQCTTAAVDQSATTDSPASYRALLCVEDAFGNSSITQLRRQPTPQLALQSAALQALRTEERWSPAAQLAEERLPQVPLLVRMRWQFDRMVQRITELTRPSVEGGSVVSGFVNGRDTSSAPGAVAWVVVRRAGAVEDGAVSSPPAADSMARGTDADVVPTFFTAAFFCEGVLVWQATSAGRYRVEFDAYVQALYYLLDQYADIVADMSGSGGPFFPTSATLAAAVDRHDAFDIVALHRGKWNGYALLGTLTSQLIGAYYQTSYAFVPPAAPSTSTQEPSPSPPGTGSAFDVRGEWRSRLTVSDGYSQSAQALIERGALTRGEAWRRACMDALRENFPRQYAAAVAAHPDVDLSGDTMAKGSKYRALPREKRVEHIGNLFSLVAAFAEEDLGWHQLRIRLRNAAGDLGLPQWIAEMEALVDDPDGAADGQPDGRASGGSAARGQARRRVVAVSAPYAQVRHAKRVLVYQVARTYFPEELAIYARLPRGDAVDPDSDPTLKRTQIYQPGGPAFTQQLTALLERKHPSLAPIAWQLSARLSSPTGDSDEATAGGDAESEELLGGEELDAAAEGCALETDVFNPAHSGNGDMRPRVDAEAEAEVERAVASLKRSQQQLAALSQQLSFRCVVLGRGGDVLISQCDGVAGQGALAVLTAALRMASDHLGGADAETLWAEYSTHAIPSMSTSRELALYLFRTFIEGTRAAPTLSSPVEADDGDDGAERPGDGAWARAAVSSFTEQSTGTAPSMVRVTAARLVGEYWLSTVCLSHAGGSLPIARAVSGTKRGSARDALLLAARRSFAQLLHHIARHDAGLAALASDILTEPVVEQLPDSVVADMHQQLNATHRRLVRESTAMPPAPSALLMRCVRRDYRPARAQRDTAATRTPTDTVVVDGATGSLVSVAPKKVVVRRSQSSDGRTHQCWLYVQLSRLRVRRGDTQLVGRGEGPTAAQALNAAALVALQNLFPEDLQDAIARDESYHDRWLSSSNAS